MRLLQRAATAMAVATASSITLPTALSTIVVMATARPAAAQNETALRTAFEGRTITVRLDLPATSQGVDVFPEEAMPVDFRQLAQRLKDNGTAVRSGQSIMVTKVVVKKDHVEFQLGGGGYGTFGDFLTGPSSVSASTAGETREERDLRDAIKQASGDDKKRMQRELDGLRSARERENGRANAEAAQANMAREANVRARRLDAGSRFNVRYKHGYPADALTPDGVMRALVQYVDFGGTPGAPAVAAAPGARLTLASEPAAGSASGSNGAATGGVGALKKGMTLQQVEALLGPAATAAESREGAMTVTRRTYRPDGAQVAASFVGGVLIDYAITPR